MGQHWKALGLESLINNACTGDRLGPDVLKELLIANPVAAPGYSSIMIPEIVAIGAWYVWWLRRKQSHGEPIPPVYRCAASIHAISANSARSVSLSYVPEKKVWKKPRSRYIKLNVDAAFNIDDSTGATGAILRDHTGNFIAASSKFIAQVPSASMAEAMAMQEGLLLAIQKDCNFVEAESDCTEVIHYCWMWNDTIAIYADCLAKVGIIGKVEFKFCPREMNNVAHTIARSCFNSKADCNWLDEPPSFLLQPLLDDVTIL
jgi:ribonuclease HI